MSILEVESNYSQWFNASIILLTASLVFYHITKIKTLEVPKIIGIVISLGLILINITITVNSLIPYMTRTSSIKNKENENVYKYIFMICGIFFIILEILICYLILKDSFKSN